MKSYVERRLKKGGRRSRPASAATLSGLGSAIGLLVALSNPAFADDQQTCSTSNKNTICGVTNVEDLVAIAGTPWVIGSSLAGGAGKAEPLYLFDSKAFTASAIPGSAIAIHPDKATYPNCPAPPDFTKFASHGLDFRGVDGHGVLYVVNHGGRESIEIFTVDTPAGAKPKLQWTGCVVAPPTAWPDGVTALPDGGFVATSLWDPHDKDFIDKLSQAKPVGGLFEWHIGKGWHEIGPSGMSGPNGVTSSADGKTLYVNLWAERKVLKYDRETKASQTVDVDMLADNVRWNQDRTYILVGGQAAPVKAVLDCFESKEINCTTPFAIYKLDPATMKLTGLVKSGVYDGMGAGTGALQVGPDLWASSFRSDRIVRFPGLLGK
jgi:hypothetical protein